MTIAFVMVTVDRAPAQNYVGATLDSLERSGFAKSGRVLLLFDSGRPRSKEFDASICRPWVAVDLPYERLTSNANHARALKAGALSGAEWVVMLEDDVEVTDSFAENVEGWLADHATKEYRVYPLYASYQQIKTAAESGATAWQYPIRAFYGTQCYAIRAGDAASIGDYLTRPDVLERWRGRTKGYDLMISEWHQADYPGLDMLASAPSMVQHVGRSSALGNEIRFHQAQSYPGTQWTYHGRAA